MKVPPSDIVVGDRIRKDVDDGIGELCASIKELGQLQPIAVDADWNLIAGARRLRACELLGINVDIAILHKIDDVLKALKAERDENECRKPFTPAELVEIGKRIEDLEKPESDKRRSPGTNQHTKEVCGNLPPTSTSGRTRDKVAEALGVSGRTYEKAKYVVAATKDETLPAEVREVAIEAAKQMDATGKIDPAYRAVKAAKDNAPPWRVTDDIVKFQSLFKKLQPNWGEEDKGTLRQFFRQLANEV